MANRETKQAVDEIGRFLKISRLKQSMDLAEAEVRKLRAKGATVGQSEKRGKELEDFVAITRTVLQNIEIIMRPDTLANLEKMAGELGVRQN